MLGVLGWGWWSMVQTRKVAWAESSNEGTAASRDDILCGHMLDHFEAKKVDVPAVCTAPFPLISLCIA